MSPSTPRRPATAFVIVGLLTASAAAQLIQTRSTADGGGGRSNAGTLVISGTIGQPDAGVQADPSGQLVLGGGFWFGGGGVVVGIEEPELPPSLPFALHASHPNPFNPATTIAFDLPERSRVELRVFNPRGELVATLIDGERPAGRHRLVWRGLDQRGTPVASGVYMIQLNAGAFGARQKITLVR